MQSIEGISKIKKELKELEISRNEVKEIPEELDQLTKLEMLHAQDNKISKIRCSFSEMENLKDIFFYNNLLEDDFLDHPLKETVFASNEHMRRIDFGKNMLSFVPKFVFNTKNLSQLSISKNNLKFIEKEISSLSNLRILDLSFNNIVSGLENINPLSSLLTIQLHDNKIQDFSPLDVTNFKLCREITMQHNCFVDLPQQILLLSENRDYYFKFNLPSLIYQNDNFCLYLGDKESASNLEVMKHRNIKKVFFFLILFFFFFLFYLLIL